VAAEWEHTYSICNFYTPSAPRHRILKEKDAAQYGARQGRLTHAVALLEELKAYAKWAEITMQGL
jgi:hypothetical protein